MRPLRRLAFGSSCGVLSACVAAWTLRGDQTGHVLSHLALFGSAFAAYLGALLSARSLSRGGLRAALVLALFWRLALTTAPPLLSDDIYRYVFEGRVQNHGGNPFAWDDRPEAERWAGQRDAVWRRVNHKEYTAIYPPLWQLAARGVTAWSESLVAMKAFAVLCEMAALLALSTALRLRSLPPERILIWAFSPLALVEIAGGGHNDALGMMLSSFALLALDRRRPLWAAVFAAGAFQAKLLPGLFGLAWLRHFRVRDVAVGIALALALTLPFLGAGSGLLMSLSKFSQYWLFNETLFAPLALALGRSGAVRAGAALTLGLALALALRRVEPARAGLLLVVAFLLLTPNVLPWYALWLLPFLVLIDAPAALLFTGTVQLAYVVYPLWQSGEAWQVGWGVRALEYLPCVAVAAWARMRESASLDWAR